MIPTGINTRASLLSGVAFTKLLLRNWNIGSEKTAKINNSTTTALISARENRPFLFFITHYYLPESLSGNILAIIASSIKAGISSIRKVSTDERCGSANWITCFNGATKATKANSRTSVPARLGTVTLAIRRSFHILGFELVQVYFLRTLRAHFPSSGIYLHLSRNGPVRLYVLPLL